MLKSEDDELLYLAGQTNTKEPADKHSLHEGYVYYLQMSFKNKKSLTERLTVQECRSPAFFPLKKKRKSFIKKYFSS